MKVLSVQGLNLNNSYKSNRNISFDGKYINPKVLENTPKNTLGVKVLNRVVPIYKRLVGLLGGNVNKVSKEELKRVHAGLVKSPVKFSPEQIEQVKKLYSKQNEELLDNMLCASEFKSYKPEHIVEMLKLQKKYPDALYYRRAIAYGGDFGDYFVDSATDLRIVMKNLPPEAPEKKEFFKDLDIDNLVKRTIEYNKKEGRNLTQEQAIDLVYLCYGRKPVSGGKSC